MDFDWKILVFQPISDGVTERASHVLKMKVDVSRLKPISNCFKA